MRRGLVSLVALVVFSTPVFAQRSTGTIRGNVSDSSGALVAGAKVTVKGEDTGYSRSVNTNAAGSYTFTELPVGMYRVDVELAGFKASSVTSIGLNVADVREVDVQLSTGAIEEQITVEAAAVSVQTTGGEVAGLITGEQVRELPLNGRNFLQLATLMPGVSAPDFLNVKDKGLLGGSDLSVSGNGVTANLWTVDGANNNDVGSNRTILIYPSLEAIDEFKIHRNSYGAEFGQAGGAQVNIVTRGGTNEFHGSVFYSGRNDALNSTNYFLKQAGKDKEKLKRNDFGWSLGGPIIKDKLQFFASQEWNRETRGSVRAAFVPTALERNGDFSGSSISNCTLAQPIDPLTGQPFPGNRIPPGRLSRGGQLLLSLYALPNTTPGAGSCNNWVDSLNSPINWRQENVRFDVALSAGAHVMLRYTQDSWVNDSPSIQANLWGDDPFPAVDSKWDQPGRSLVAQLTNNIGSSAVNSLQFSYSANKITVTRGGTDADLNNRINAAIPSLYPDSIREYGSERGHPVFWGGGGYDALWNEAPFRNNQDLFVLKDDYSAVFGKHFVKVGALASMNKKNEDVGGFGSFENSAFWGAAGLNGWGGGTTGNLLADFLLKDMAFGFSENASQRQVPQRWKDLEFYAADSWKVSPRVTFDFGLRYSRLLNAYADDNKILSFNPDRYDAKLGADPCNGMLQPPGTNWCQDAGFRGGSTGPNRSLYEQDGSMFAPRLGLAWDVFGTGKTAIRVGAGQFFLRERLSPGLNIGNNPPFATNTNGLRKLDTAAEPCDGCFGVTSGVPNSGRNVAAGNPYTMQWNLSFQQEIARNTTLELGYVGSRGRNLLQAYDVNQVRSGDVNKNGINDRLEYARTTPALGDVRPFAPFGDHRIVFWDHTGRSIYHSLQTQLLSRFGHGSQFQASYTWSKVLSNDPLDNSSGGLAADVATTDLGNPDLDYGRAKTDRTHIFNASLVLALPSLDGRSGLAKGLFGNWEFGTIVIAETGTPLTVFTGPIPGLNGGPSGTGYTDNQRPNRVEGQPCRATSGPKEQWLNPGAFTLTGFQLGSIGNSGRGICTGPGFFQVDVSLYKMIKLSERTKIQLRFEVFNLLNRTNFLSLPGGSTTMNPSDATFNGPVGEATQITGFTLPGTFGQASSARDPRQAQFGIKLIF